MADRNTRNVDDPTAEVLATCGLVALLGAVMAAAIAVVALGGGSTAMGGILGAVALLSFVASLALFILDSKRSEGAPLPFPSLLRTDSETAAERSAPS